MILTVECETLAIRFLISTIRSQATVTQLLRWLSTKHNLIDLAEKAFPASELKDTSKKELTRNLIIANMDEANYKRGSSTQFERINRHSQGEQEQGPWIAVKGLVATVTTNQSLFLEGKHKY